MNKLYRAYLTAYNLNEQNDDGFFDCVVQHLHAAASLHTDRNCLC